MNLVQADKIISSFLSTSWTTTPIAWANVEPRNFQVAGQPLLPLGTADYLAVRTRGIGSQTITVDGSCIRYTGQLFLAMCVKDGTGVRIAKERLSSLIGMLENATLTGEGGSVRMRTLTGPVGYSAENGWYVEEIGIMFNFERFTV